MEFQVSPQGQKHNLQTLSRKSSPGGLQKDLCLVVHEGSLADIDSAIAQLKKNGGNINSRNMFGLTPLHIATWRNHIPIVRRLLDAGADPDARDGESGWSSLHRAFHFGHLAVANILLQSSASILLEDCKSRTPVDLLSGPVSQAIGSENDSVATEVYSWGSGTNYQLGTGNAHLQKLPCKVDSLHGSVIKLISAAKFHSVAVTTSGEVYTWGFGRGGRLGHPDFDIHSGQAAVITPRQVTSGLGSRRVKTIAAAKHHTVLATEGGEVFTWGSNREGQLGYTSVDTQPTPRRVSSLKSRIVAVAAANKHTAVVSESHEVFTWGCNREGQLGYGTSNSASNYTPRLVEYLKGKILVGVSAAKYHTLALTSDGEVYTWGHRLVTPKRIIIARNLKKSGSTPMKFHRMERLHVVAIAAGLVYSVALSKDGALFYWASSDPELKSQQLNSLRGTNVVSIAAGKYWTAAVTSIGDVYMWDGKRSKDNPPQVTRLHGVKRATSVSVGETHLLIVGSLYLPVYPHYMTKNSQKLKSNMKSELEEFDFVLDDLGSNNGISTLERDDPIHKSVPTLKSLCEKVAADCLVEPRNALQMLEIADALGAGDLRKHCEDIVLRNLDYILTVSCNAFSTASLDILANLEKSLDQRSSEPWSYRRLPTPTATFPVIINSEEEDSDSGVLRTRDNHMQVSSTYEGNSRFESFLHPKDDPNQGIGKQVRALRKKLQQIEMLEVKQSHGDVLDEQQIAKIQSRSALESSLAELGVPAESSQQARSLSAALSDGKGNKKSAATRKHRKKNQKVTQVETVSGFSVTEADPRKDLFDVEASQILVKEEDVMFEENMTIQSSPMELSFLVQKKDVADSPKHPASVQTSTKKKTKNKKGGLSMFLSGALDDNPKPAAPPPTPKSEGPAWGGAKVAKGSASLREIQDEQSKVKVNQPARNNKEQLEDLPNSRSEGKVLLSSFLPSKPIPMVSTRTQQASDADKGTPPWAASGTPPSLRRPSLRDIQIQQGKHQSLSHSPKTNTAGFSVASGQGSPSESPGMNRWFKPEVGIPSSIRSIQIEEKAMKDLKRFYSSVKVVKNQS